MGPGLDRDQGLRHRADAAHGRRPGGSRRKPASRTLAGFLWRRRGSSSACCSRAPLGWLVVAYLGSLAVLFAAALWRLDTFTGEIVQDPGFQNFQTL